MSCNLSDEGREQAKAAGQVLDSARNVSNQAEDLHREIENYLAETVSARPGQEIEATRARRTSCARFVRRIFETADQ